MKSIFYKVILALGFALVRLVLKRIEKLDLSTSGELIDDWNYIIFSTKTKQAFYFNTYKDLKKQFKQESKSDNVQIINK